MIQMAKRSCFRKMSRADESVHKPENDFVSALREVSLARELYSVYPLKGIADMEISLTDDLENLIAERSVSL